jgi:putative tryptophan/tyrosine transport system substrate-binding protein
MNRNIYIIVALVVTLFTIVYFSNGNGNGDSSNESKIHKVAFISLSVVDDNTFKGFKKKMNSYGWEEGENIQYIVPGAANKIKNLPSIVKSVIKQKPDLILVSSTPATQEVKKAVKGLNIPVVFCPVNDPVSSKILVNQNAPKGNITGIRLPTGDSKRFEWLHTISPNIKNVLIPYSKNDESAIASRDAIREVAKSLNITLIEKAFLENMTIKQFFEKCSNCSDAIFLPRDSRIEAKIQDFVKYSIDNKLPLSAPSYQQVQKGALFTYGFIHEELGKQSARMADRILRGVKPEDLPVKYGNAYLVINKKTANKINISFSDNVIRNAKLIIE